MSALVSSGRFRAFLGGAVVSATGNGAQDVAVAVLAHDLTGSALVVGIAGGARFAPAFVASGAAGRLIDRSADRARLIAVTQAILTALSAGFYALALVGAVNAGAVIAFALLTGLCVAVDVPARQALAQDLATEEQPTVRRSGHVAASPHLAAAASLAATTIMVGFVSGPGLAGVVLAGASRDAVFVASAVAFAVAGLVFAALSAGSTRSVNQGPGAAAEPGPAGILVALRTPSLGPVVGLTLAVTVLSLNTEPALLVLVSDTLGQEAAFAPLLTLMGAGGIVGAAATAWWPRPDLLGLVGLAGALASSLVAMAAAPNVWTVGAVCLVGGGAGGAFAAAGEAYIQSVTPPGRHGAAEAAYWGALIGAGVVGGPVAGGLAGSLGGRGAYTALGLLLAVAVGLAWLNTDRRPAITAVAVAADDSACNPNNTHPEVP